MVSLNAAPQSPEDFTRIANAGFLDYSQTGNRIGSDMPAKRA